MEKSADAFRTISEVADHLDTPAHVLRFWESRFPQIKPVKRAGGRRYYRPSDVALLEGIKRLLHAEGMTIRGVQKVLREHGVRHVAGLGDDPSDEEVALEVALADIEVAAKPVLDAPAAEEATVTVLQDAMARLRPAQPGLWDGDISGRPADQPGDIWDVAPPPAPAPTTVAGPAERDAESVSVPTGPTHAARLRARGAPLAAGNLAALRALAARLTALRARAIAASRPGSL